MRCVAYHLSCGRHRIISKCRANTNWFQCTVTHLYTKALFNLIRIDRRLSIEVDDTQELLTIEQ